MSNDQADDSATIEEQRAEAVLSDGTRIILYTHPDGSWEGRVYDPSGKVLEWEDFPLGPRTAANANLWYDAQIYDQTGEGGDEAWFHDQFGDMVKPC